MARSCLMALGSNLGDRLAHLRTGLRAIHGHGLAVAQASSLWESQAFGGDPTLSYLNAVVELTGVQDPWDLLDLCKRIERDAGRDAGAPRNAPRCLDLDVLAVERFLLRSPAYSLPHPRMQGRAFVWRPLAELSDLERFHLEAPKRIVRGELVRVAGKDWMRIPDPPGDRP